LKTIVDVPIIARIVQKENAFTFTEIKPLTQPRQQNNYIEIPKHQPITNQPS
jgi:hypothetical protein